MSDEILELFIKQKLQSDEYSEETYVWQGGEPTLAGIDFFRNLFVLNMFHNLKMSDPRVFISF